MARNPFYQTGNVDTSTAGRVDVESVRVHPGEDEEVQPESLEGEDLAASEGTSEETEGLGEEQADSVPQDTGDETPAAPEEETEEVTEEVTEESAPEEEAESESSYDPSAYSVTEVNEYLASHDEEREAILAAEAAGKARKGILEA